MAGRVSPANFRWGPEQSNSDHSRPCSCLGTTRYVRWHTICASVNGLPRQKLASDTGSALTQRRVDLCEFVFVAVRQTWSQDRMFFLDA